MGGLFKFKPMFSRHLHIRAAEQGGLNFNRTDGFFIRHNAMLKTRLIAFVYQEILFPVSGDVEVTVAFDPNVVDFQAFLDPSD